ncbi:MAG: N-acetylglucosaminyldiphosphoundecaprenol N-acetyl-beta-D-mannosaminyltransferase [Arenicella sp.]|jgi:N-acetylglucosaminyldiphosphoundecaprenol N-acetyl-beta-D-mannosaminyltransferase
MRILLSVVVLLFMLPKVATQCLSAMYRQKKIHIYSNEYLGLGMKCIQHRTFMINNCALSDFDSWLHYLKGNLDFIGPERLSMKESLLLTRNQRRRFDVAPGLISPYKIKRASGIAYKTEYDIAIEFVDGVSGLRRFQLALIWLVQALVGSTRSKMDTLPTFNLFGVMLNNVSMADAIKSVMNSLNKDRLAKDASKFAFVNADCGNNFFNDPGYKQILNGFDQVYPDGIGVKIAARMQGCSLKENVNGTDMFPLLCEQLQARGKSLYLHGASAEAVKKLVDNLRASYPSLDISGYSDGYSYANKPEALRNRINQSQADLLLIALGAPRQERWIEENSCKLDVAAVIGVGGLFDFYSGEVSRAPEWLRELSMEWVWRLVQQPKDKLHRYLIGNPLFLVRSIRQSLSNQSYAPVVGRAQ